MSGLDCEAIPVWRLSTLWEESSEDPTSAIPRREHQLALPAGRADVNAVAFTPHARVLAAGVEGRHKARLV